MILHLKCQLIPRSGITSKQARYRIRQVAKDGLFSKEGDRAPVGSAVGRKKQGLQAGSVRDVRVRALLPCRFRSETPRCGDLAAQR